MLEEHELFRGDDKHEKKGNAKPITVYAETQVKMLERNKIQFSFLSKHNREYEVHSEQHKHVSKGKI